MRKLTVIIPVYNGADYIGRCLDSLNRQTFRDFVVAVFNDGSKDNSAEVIRAYAREHPELPLELTEQENRGVAETRNAGIERCETPWIAFMDQDDEAEPDYLATYMKAAEETDADIVCGGYRRVDPETGKVLRTVSLCQDPWSKFVVVSPWAHLYRTAFLQENRIRFLTTPIGEDVYFTLTAYSHTDKVTVIPDSGYRWMDNPKSHSNSRQRAVSREIDPFILLDALDRDLPVAGCIPREYLEYYLYRYVIWYILFTGRRTPRAVLTEQYRRLEAWLSARFPRFWRNRLISPFRPKGEPFSIRLPVWGFNLLYRLRLDKAFLALLSVGNGKQ